MSLKIAIHLPTYQPIHHLSSVTVHYTKLHDSRQFVLAVAQTSTMVSDTW